MQLEVRIHSIRPSDSIKGTASVNINGAFAIRGVKIIEGSNGLFVSMPSYKAGNEYKDICFPPYHSVIFPVSLSWTGVPYPA